MKLSRETLQYLPNFWNEKTFNIYKRFNSKVAWNEKRGKYQYIWVFLFPKYGKI